MFAGNYAPKGWATCDGQILPVAQNQVLFALLGGAFGGDGQTTFALPDLRGRVPIHQGTGVLVTPGAMGDKGGSEVVSLVFPHLPSHQHTLMGSESSATGRIPQSGQVFAEADSRIYGRPSTTVPMSPSTIGSTGSGNPHSNVQPFLCVTFIIALEGIFPERG